MSIQTKTQTATVSTIGLRAKKGDFAAIQVESSYTKVGGETIRSTCYHLRIVARVDRDGRVMAAVGPDGIAKGPFKGPLFVIARGVLKVDRA